MPNDEPLSPANENVEWMSVLWLISEYCDEGVYSLSLSLVPFTFESATQTGLYICVI